MRPSPKKFVVPIVGLLVLALVAGALALAISLVRHGTTTSTAQTEATNAPDAYHGRASWIDVWDSRAWNDPAAAVKDMSDHGVRTIFIQTGNARSAQGIANPSALREFITEAHAHHMFVVAWYLPNLKSGSDDYDRVIRAIEFETSDGQRFDSFALDIESTAVKSISTRNVGLVALSKRLRDKVGTDYPLGAIIPSPVGIEKETGFWDVFPYAEVAESYDVLLPMAYYTFDANTPTKARTYALESMRILRAQPGCAKVPVHLIGGIASRSTGAEIREFAKAAAETGCIGVSIYDWAGMNDKRWRGLRTGWPASSK